MSSSITRAYSLYIGMACRYFRHTTEHDYSIMTVLLGERELVLQLARAVCIIIYDRHHTVYFSKCFYALLFHRHLSTFHTMRMRGVSTCTVLAVYKVVQMDPEDRRRARLSRRRQRERDRRVSESAEQRESRLARRRARDGARRASQSETIEDREARLQQLSRLQRQRLASETLEEREARLQQQRLVSETLEDSL